MTGRKTLGEVKAELETALGTGPAGDGAVAESLRRFLTGGTGPGPATPPPGPGGATGVGQPSPNPPLTPPV